MAEGEGWTISNDGTLVVTGVTGNVSIVHWGFSENSLPSSNLPSYLQHSVAIVIAMVVAVTVIVAIIIKVKSKGHSGEK